MDNSGQIVYGREPIIRSLQITHIPVTAFSQTDLFLVWIYLEFRSPQEPQWPIAITSTDVDMFTWGRIVLSLPERAHVDWNWPISREKYHKIDCSVKMPFHWLIMRVSMGGPFDGWRLKISRFDGWRLNFRSFDGWRLIFRNDVYHTNLEHKFGCKF